MVNEAIKKIKKFFLKYKKKPLIFSAEKINECLIRIDLNEDITESQIYQIFYCPHTVVQAIEQYLVKYGEEKFIYMPFIHSDEEVTCEMKDFTLLTIMDRKIIEAYELCSDTIFDNGTDIVSSTLFRQIANTALREKGITCEDDLLAMINHYNRDSECDDIDWRKSIPFFQLLGLL